MSKPPMGPDDVDVEQEQETDNDNEKTDMSQNDSQRNTMIDELNTVMAGQNPLQSLKVTQTGPVHYTVLSARNGGATAHRVNVAELTCTCEDMEYNTDDDRNVCAHVAKALLSAPANGTAETMGVSQLYHVVGRLQDQLEDLETEAEVLRDHATAAGTERRAQEASDAAETDTTPDKGIDPDEAAERLTEAYAGVGIDIETTIDVDNDTGQERIWIETAEQISESKFGAFLQDPDLVRYDPDEKDGYMNNYVKPSEVDEVIEEVF
jgi:hypothetical protein